MISTQVFKPGKNLA